MPEILKFKKKQPKTATAWSSKVIEYLCLQINVLSKKKKKKTFRCVQSEHDRMKCLDLQRS